MPNFVNGATLAGFNLHCWFEKHNGLFYFDSGERLYRDELPTEVEMCGRTYTLETVDVSNNFTVGNGYSTILIYR